MNATQAAPALEVTMVRCATVLLRWGALAFLTDPWFRMHMRGLPVFRRPGLAPAALPPLDAILASHLHPDHWDEGALDQMRPAPARVILPPGAGGLVRPRPGASVEELAPWSATRVGDVTVWAVPGPHTFPPPDEINFVLELPGWGRVFFGGDSRYDREALLAIAARFAPLRLALLPVGGTRILGRQTTMGPDEAFRAAVVLRAETVIPIHEGGLWLSVPPLSLHPGRARHLAARFRRAGHAARLIVLREGDSVKLG